MIGEGSGKLVEDLQFLPRVRTISYPLVCGEGHTSVVTGRFLDIDDGPVNGAGSERDVTGLDVGGGHWFVLSAS